MTGGIGREGTGRSSFQKCYNSPGTFGFRQLETRQIGPVKAPIPGGSTTEIKDKEDLLGLLAGGATHAEIFRV
jgi:hypothetical protein